MQLVHTEDFGQLAVQLHSWPKLHSFTVVSTSTLLSTSKLTCLAFTFVTVLTSDTSILLFVSSLLDPPTLSEELDPSSAVSPGPIGMGASEGMGETDWGRG